MKNIKLENLFVISLIITSLLFGNFYSFVWCGSEECCETECCSENSDYAGLVLSVNNADCCEYSQGVDNEIHAVPTLNTNVKLNISTLSNLVHYIPDNYEVKGDVNKSTTNQFSESHSSFILRI